MKNNITITTKFINEHINDSINPTILNWLTLYIHTSHKYTKQNFDKTYLTIQPSFPNNTVKEFHHYTDNAFNYSHKTHRLMLIFDDNTEYDISLYKFKKFCRQYNSLNNKILSNNI